MKGLVLAACVVLAACGSAKTPENGGTTTTTSSGEEIHITTGATSYAPGSQVTLSIHNATARQFAFNPCTRTFEREGHGAVPEPGRVCTMEAWLLEPNATREATTDLPSGLVPGTYRLSIDFGAQDPGGTGVRATSNPFTVASN